MAVRNSVDQLLKSKAGGALPPLWFILGDEPLLAIEAQDSIRRAAFANGYTERKSFSYEGNADYSELYEALGDMSLFGEKSLIEVTFPRSTIGRNGPEAVKAMIKAADETKIVVVSLLQYDWTTEKKDWFIALKNNAKLISAEPIPRNRLPLWITERIQAVSGQALSAEAADFIAEKTEGNLLATLQEIQKLTLLCQKPEIDLNDVIDAVSDVSRFDQETLFIAFLEGDAGRVSKIIDSLEAENTQIPSFLWRLSDDVRRMILHKQGRKFSSFGIDSNHIFALKKAAGRTTLKRLELILHRLSEVDRLSKGLFVEKSDGNAWQELKAACLLLAAKKR